MSLGCLLQTKAGAGWIDGKSATLESGENHHGRGCPALSLGSNVRRQSTLRGVTAPRLRWPNRTPSRMWLLHRPQLLTIAGNVDVPEHWRARRQQRRLKEISVEGVGTGRGRIHCRAALVGPHRLTVVKQASHS